MAESSALNIRREWLREVVRAIQLIAGDLLMKASVSSAALLNSYKQCLPQPANVAERLVLRSLVTEVALHVGRAREAAAPETCANQHLFEVMTSLRNVLAPLDDHSGVPAPSSRPVRLSPDQLSHPAPSRLADDVGRFIDENYRARLTVQVIAKAVGRSPSHVRRAFRNAFGLPVHAYLTAVRVKRGLIALTESNIKVEAISMMVGYKSTKDFYRACRQLTGLTPGDIRHRPPGDLLAVTGALTAALARRKAVPAGRAPVAKALSAG